MEGKIDRGRKEGARWEKNSPPFPDSPPQPEARVTKGRTDAMRCGCPDRPRILSAPSPEFQLVFSSFSSSPRSLVVNEVELAFNFPLFLPLSLSFDGVLHFHLPIKFRLEFNCAPLPHSLARPSSLQGLFYRKHYSMSNPCF